MLAALLLSSSLVPSPLSDDPPRALLRLREEPRLVVSAGILNLSGETDGTAFGFEYRWPYQRDPWWGIEELAPIAGVVGDTASSFYGYAGFRYDWDIGDPWVVTPSLSVGFYEPGDGVDLGQALEFRSSIELSRSIGESTRLGLSFFHLSNAGLSDSNPGTNGLTLNVSWSPRGD